MHTTHRRPNGLRARFNRIFLPGSAALCILIVIALFSVGCARPTSSGSLAPTDRDIALRQIAADYARSGDLVQAQAALNRLGVANPAQLLLTLAEADLAAGQPREQIESMARLAEALGQRSPKLIAYLEPTVAPTPTPVPPTATPLPPTEPPSPTPTSRPATETPTPEPPTATPTPEPQQPRVVADSNVNLRSGPGRAYPVIGQLRAGQEVAIQARNANGDWWQVAWGGPGQAWVAGTVVRVLGPIDTVAVAANIPPPPPQPTAAPRPTAAPTQPPRVTGPDFQLVSRRLWGVEENGGSFSGPSVNCGGKHVLHVYVQDAAGQPLNGVTVMEVGGNHQELVSGSKDNGMVEYNLFPPGKDVIIIRDVDGHQVTSDTAAAPTLTEAIPFDILMAARYCSDTADCSHFLSQGGCNGHYSWDVIFRRAY